MLQKSTKFYILDNARSPAPTKMTEVAIASLILWRFVGYSWNTTTPQSRFTSKLSCVNGYPTA